ncbi:MAG: chromophore lyase CpcT/CpeT [Steroidobacteraceae bacterium]
MSKRSCGYLTSVAASALVCLALAGCASTKEKPDVALQELVLMFPGHYDNTAQVEADIAHGVQPPHEALALDIVPIEAIMIGENVFYVQESIAGDPKRVLGQKVVMFGVVKKEIVQTDYALGEPHRWRNGHLNPDLFKGLMIQDVHSTKGCSLRWKRSAASDGHFTGTNDPKTCHGRAGGAGSITQIQARAELGPVEYATAELAFDKPGHLAQGRQDEPFYRFRKSHDAGQ